MRRILAAVVVFGWVSLASGQIVHNPFGDSPQAPLKSAAKAADNAANGDPARDLLPYVKQFVEVMSAVKSQSSEAQDANKMIYEGAIPAMLRQLDPHTQFFDPGQFQQLKQMQDSEQKGFGSVVSVLPGQVLFLQTLPGTPSNKAGIQAGDSLIAVNNVAIQQLDPEQITELLTEARQQKITVYIRRQGFQKTFQFTLTPELVDLPSVERGVPAEAGLRVHPRDKLGFADGKGAQRCDSAARSAGEAAGPGARSARQSRRHRQSGAGCGGDVSGTGRAHPDRQGTHARGRQRRRPAKRQALPLQAGGHREREDRQRL